LLKKESNNKMLQLVLSDGSVVSLQPNSRIYYSKDFTGKNREVILEGEAFFLVKRDPSKPFLVYYHNIVTKVLGTSFNVRTLARTNNFEVAVKTGKVQVYENEKTVKKGNLAKTVIITPNQRAVYNSTGENFEKLLVEQPQLIQNKATSENKPNKFKKEIFIYNQNKLIDIFHDLSEQYGIDIIPENENINNCLFTGDLSSQDLFTKLKIICLTINASYETIGTQIIVKGKGCALPKLKLR
jgi:ribosomal protein L30E